MAVAYCSRNGSSRKPDPSPIFTIGHSIHPIADFLALVKCAGPRVLLVDVRSNPHSRRPWFNSNRLSAVLATHGHGYHWLPSLGGRQGLPFLDYLNTSGFERGIAQVLGLERRSLPLILLCSESDPAECHRWFIASELTARGRNVAHILKDGTLLGHTEGAR